MGSSWAPLGGGFAACTAPASAPRMTSGSSFLLPTARASVVMRGSLRKAFSGFGLLMLGLGIVIGSGWAQLSGMAGQQYAGCAARAALTLGACRLIACRAACAQEGLAPLCRAVRAGS